jgi:hypothetical protein
VKKYVITDEDGFTEDKFQLKLGKIVFSTKKSSKDPIKAVIENIAFDHPLLAALRSPNSTDPDVKMYMLQIWTIDLDLNNPQAYVIVRDELMPTVSLNDKFTFAMSVIKDIYNLDEVTDWVDNWLSNEDRSMDSVNELNATLEHEKGNNRALADLSQKFAAAGSGAQIDELNDLIARTLHLTAAAAESIHVEPDRDFIEKDITIALLDIEKYRERVDFIKNSDENAEFSHKNVVTINVSVLKCA